MALSKSNPICERSPPCSSINLKNSDENDDINAFAALKKCVRFSPLANQPTNDLMISTAEPAIVNVFWIMLLPSDFSIDSAAVPKLEILLPSVNHETK